MLKSFRANPRVGNPLTVICFMWQSSFVWWDIVILRLFVKFKVAANGLQKIKFSSKVLEVFCGAKQEF